ncbi:iron-containing alcohol dehydrogenase [Vreelandella nanhaiensis]|uniref:Iron-containing alcohol dehydrogenase n=1 Tax=Vreelandella nanhaiensis TaxID=1258546 RepID=A0A433KTR9_9GAMM|nr:iron-containing alcohol dehydrogenase [Halomonas nanhaiensis]RUR33051.1 iron-containing alcohol dehydrogenase [Halomonas nanhaiensis]
MPYIINYLTKIQFGENAIAELANELQLLKVKRPLFVTDKGLSSTPIITQVIESAELSKEINEKACIFDETPSNPTETAVEQALTFLRESECDGIVAVGGGSSIDLAKAVALLFNHPAPLRQYAAIEGGVAKINANVLPLIAVPTTAGTGSEVGRASLITMKDNRKLGFLSPYLIPAVAICDPRLTLGLPPFLTAATGMDAIAHCVETFLSPKLNPPAEAIALDGLKRASTYLVEAVENGANLTARNEMMMAALEGAMAFQKGLGAVHSLSHALGGLHELKLHHGTLNAVLMPTVLRFNQRDCEEKYARLKDAMGLAPDDDLAEAFEKLNIKLGMPSSLSEMGVKEEHLNQVAQWALEDHSTATNPRAPSKEDFFKMLKEVF